eukprot:284911_1
MFIRLEIGRIGLTNIAVQSDSTNDTKNHITSSLTLRYIDMVKMEKRSKNDEWVALTASETKCLNVFKDFAIWKFSGEWENASVNCLINKHEYTADVVCDIRSILNKNWEADEGEMTLRSVLWDGKKK